MATMSILRSILLIVFLATGALQAAMGSGPIGAGRSDATTGLRGVSGCELLRNKETSLRRYVAEHTNVQRAFNLQKPASWGYVVGSTKTFWADNLDNNTQYQVPSTCRAVGTNAYVFIEDALWARGRATQASADSILKTFDQAVPASATKGIYQMVTENFGDPPDVDNDPRIIILILDIQDGYTPGSGSYVAGYFYSLNEYPDGTDGLHSNEAEIYYIDGYPGILTTSSGLAVASSVTAHEFQHMIHWDHDPNELTFVDESCAETAAIVCGYPYEDQQLYTNSTDVYLLGWSGQLSDYARGARWGLYLLNQYPTNFFTTLVADQGIGIAGINGALNFIGAGRTFDNIYDDWLIANYLNDRTVDTRYGYTYAGSLTQPNTTSYNGDPNTGLQNVSVRSLGADYLKFTGSQNFNITFSAVSSNIKVNAVEIGSSSKRVVSVPLGTAFSESQFGTTYSTIAFVVDNHTQSNGTLSYSYQAVSSPGGTSTVALGTATGTSAGQTITIPVTTTDGLSDVGAISLQVGYSTTYLTFIGIENGPSGMIANASGGNVMIGWYSTTAINVSSGGKVVDLKFTYNGGLSNGQTTPLTFVTSGCQISNSAAVPMSISYTDGAVTGGSSPTSPVLVVSPDTQSVANTAGTTSFAVSNGTSGTTMSWTASVGSGASWLSISSGSSGTNSGTITLDYLANTGAARTGTVIVTASGATGSPETVRVIQAAGGTGGNTLTIGTATASSTGQTITIPITATNGLSDVGAISLQVGYSSTYLTFVGIENGPSGMIANASGGNVMIGWYSTTAINVSSGGKVVDLKFTYNGGLSNGQTTPLTFVTSGCQISNSAAVPMTITYTDGSVIGGSGTSTPALVVTPDVQSVGSSAGTTTFAVSNGTSGTTMNWTASVASGSSWLSISSGSSGTNSGTITVDYTANTSAARTGTVTVTAPGATGSPETVTVGQSASGNVIVIGTATASNTGEALTISITAPNGLSDVGAISLQVGYSTTYLTFVGIENGPSGMIANASGGNVMIGWYSTTAINVSSGGNIVDLKFTYNGGLSNGQTTPLTFVTSGCQISNSAAVPMSVTYTNGLVTGGGVASPILSVTPDLQAVGSASGTTMFEVSNGASGTTMAWTAAVISGSNWLSISSGASGTNSGTITLNYTATTNAIRTGTVRITAPGATGSPKTVTVSQSGPGNSLAIGTATATTGGQTITVPVTAPNGLSDIGAISLQIGYNPVYLTYVGIQNAPSDMISNASGGNVMIGWYSTTPINISSGGKVLDLQFRYTGASGASTTPLTFITSGCQLSNSSAVPITITSWNNGYVVLSPDDIDALDNEPGKFRLEQNYPNPFNPSTTIGFTIPRAGTISLTLYNQIGYRVRQIANGYCAPGTYRMRIDCQGLASGVYIVELRYGTLRDVRKITLLK